MVLEVKELKFAYKKNTDVLDNISFTIKKGDYICLLGPNGVGKSTLFKCMLSLNKKYKGEIFLHGKNIKQYSIKELSRIIAYIPQSSEHAFNYRVEEIVLMGTSSLTSYISSPGKKELKIALESLERLGILKLRDKMFLNLSGGERQLVLIARALAQQAKILFMDEPTSNLDYGNQFKVLQEMKKLSVQGYTIIQSTHNPDQAFMYADKVLAINNKKLESYGKPKKVITKELMNDLYGVEVEIEHFYNGNLSICVPKKLKASV